MKTRLIALSLILGTCGYSQYLSFNKASSGTNVITVPSGEAWQLITYSAYSTVNSVVEIFSVSTNPSSASLIGRLALTSEYLVSQDTAANGAWMAAGSVLVGPAYIKTDYLSSYYFAFKKLFTPQSGTTPSTAVVIPISSTGDVDVKMEQSADNVTWTECLPGTYNSSTVKRFFRLRAVEK